MDDIEAKLPVPSESAIESASEEAPPDPFSIEQLEAIASEEADAGAEGADAEEAPVPEEEIEAAAEEGEAEEAPEPEEDVEAMAEQAEAGEIPEPEEEIEAAAEKEEE
jgi:hypothetical protein